MSEAHGGDIWTRLVEVARWAPSPHNTQPWRVRPRSATGADLYMERARMLPDEDTTGRFLECAMGIFIEALSIAAAAEGLSLTAENVELDTEAALVHVARLGLREGAPKEPLNAALLLRRRTSRLPHDGAPVEERVLAAVRDEVAAGGGQALTWTDDAGLIGEVLDRNVAAVFHDLNVGPYRREIASWFRYTRGQAERTRDGLDARCMRMPGYEMYLSTVFPASMRWGVTKPLMRALYHARLGGAKQLGFLSGPFFAGREEAQAAGRCLLRVWLTLAAEDVSIHPFGNLVTNGAAHSWLTGRLGVERVWLVFRFGRTPVPPRSLRLAAGEVLCGR
ncbi:MAG: hypothetical protein HND58_05750 [Planctomycetota bacterium]|nr:MAG: hypothetical protein HND58_05750 [Planctomycetota bacterium]